MIKKKLIQIIYKYNPKVIFNLAAETHVDRSIDSPDSFIHSNILGVFNILELLRFLKERKNIKLIHISTDEVYGDIKHKRSLEQVMLSVLAHLTQHQKQVRTT